LRISTSRGRGLVAASILLAALTACSPPASSNASGSDAAKATSATDLGGLDKLIEAAKKEGELNVIALPPDWANYGEIIKGFTAKYGIKVNSASPTRRARTRSTRPSN
jgi:putative spermidine/putrescine transport system substrate-binding protein